MWWEMLRPCQVKPSQQSLSTTLTGNRTCHHKNSRNSACRDLCNGETCLYGQFSLDQNHYASFIPTSITRTPLQCRHLAVSIWRRFGGALSLCELSKDERADQTASTFGSQWRTTKEIVLRCSEKFKLFSACHNFSQQCCPRGGGSKQSADVRVIVRQYWGSVLTVLG